MGTTLAGLGRKALALLVLLAVAWLLLKVVIGVVAAVAWIVVAVVALLAVAWALRVLL
ncbi:MAG: hypothetical protein M3N16_06275 [Actinomycetota bacterium]|nr:hypothetical protein [Actinomycetota bacterium]